LHDILAGTLAFIETNMKYLIDLSGIIDLETFHEYVSKKLDFPAYYGQNFDAFWDCLTDMDSKSKIRVEGLSDFKKNLPDAYDKFKKCIDDYRQEYGRIEFMLFEDSPSGEGLINNI
jgi:RNAse (barnase) inhibitor barstar